jgi:hypothetical protein
MRPDCQFPAEVRDAQGCVPLPLVAAAEDCDLPAGFCFSVHVIPVDVHGHPLGGRDSEYGPTCPHYPQPKRKKMSAPVAEHHDAPALPEAPAPAEQLKATVAVPATAASELQALAAEKDIDPLAVVMAALAALFGTAGWKFYNNFSKRKHAENMARIEKQDDDRKQCKSGHADLSAKLAAMESRLAAAEKKGGETGFDLGDFDAEAVERRLKKLERKVKKLAEDDSEEEA